MASRDTKAAAAAIDAFLRAIGADTGASPDLSNTAESVARAFCDDLCRGYDVDPVRLLEADAIDAGPSGTEVVILRDLAVTTTCPHHLMPATGVATVAFAPRARIVGIGAVGRALDGYARRLTLQETIGVELARALQSALAPRWSACKLSMTHTCLTARGERRHGAIVETVAVQGEGDRALVYALLGAGGAR